MLLFQYNSESLRIFHRRDTSPEAGQFLLHAHRTNELYYFISGSGYYTVEGNDYPLTPGTILVMRSGEAHTPHLRADISYERIAINFEPDVFPILKDEIREIYQNRPLGKENLYLPREETKEYIGECMQRAVTGEKDPNVREHILAGLIPVILELYQTKKNGLNRASVSPVGNVFDGSPETISRIINYINDNLTTIENLDVLEQEFFFSKSYINRLFKQSTGSSVWDYIVLKRLILARSLLLEGKQANIVASECGFCDYSSFYRQFKQRFGISPISTRKNKK